MKRAKVYYQEIKDILLGGNEEEINKAIIKTFRSVLVEIKEVSDSRGVKTDSAIMSIVREQNDKWNSICNKAGKDGITFLKRDSIRDYFDREILI